MVEKKADRRRERALHMRSLAAKTVEEFGTQGEA